MSGWCKSKSELDDFIAFVVLYGPDDFPSWRHMTIERALNEIVDAIDRFSAEIGAGNTARARQLAADAKQAYAKNDPIKGAHLLQDLAELL